MVMVHGKLKICLDPVSKECEPYIVYCLIFYRMPDARVLTRDTDTAILSLHLSHSGIGLTHRHNFFTTR